MKNIAHLIRLANRIALFFEAFPDRAEGVEGVAEHIQKFWEPRMRLALLHHLDTNPQGTADGITLHPLALEALQHNKTRLMPRQAGTPA